LIDQVRIERPKLLEVALDVAETEKGQVDNCGDADIEEIAH